MSYNDVMGKTYELYMIGVTKDKIKLCWSEFIVNAAILVYKPLLFIDTCDMHSFTSSGNHATTIKYRLLAELGVVAVALTVYNVTVSFYFCSVWKVIIELTVF